MNEQNAYNIILLKRFFNRFQEVSYRQIPVCRYVYRPFLKFVNRCRGLTWAKENLPHLPNEMNQFSDADVYGILDEPYPYDPNPEGICAVSGSLRDIASLPFSDGRFVLICRNRTEAEFIKTSRPDIVPVNIENFYRDNPKAVRYLNLQITHIVRELTDDPILGSLGFLQWYQSKMPEVTRILDAVHGLFTEMSIRSLLTMSSFGEVDGALILAAKARRIPSLTLQHGIMAPNDLLDHVPVLATKKLVWGSAVARWYHQYGYPQSRIAVTGSPRFDILLQRKWPGKHELHQRLGIDPGKKIAVYATEPLNMAPINVPIVLEGLKPFPGLYLLMMLHPAENHLVTQYHRLCKDYANQKIIPHGAISLYDALSGADIFITCFSTAALEAMIFNLPVITVEPFPPKFSFGELGASLCVRNAHELGQVIHNLLSIEPFRLNAMNQYRSFLSDYCITDGMGTQRLLNEINTLLRNEGAV